MNGQSSVLLALRGPPIEGGEPNQGAARIVLEALELVV
jgi:hypothetical protein